MATKPTKKATYTATLIVAGRKFTGTGDSAFDALSKISAQKYKGRGILVMEHGASKKEKILMPQQVVQLTQSMGMNRDAALKRTALVFEGI